MRHFRWIILVRLALALGVLIVEYMTVHPIRMSAFLLLSAITGFAHIVFVTLGFRGKRFRFIALGVVLVALLAGYLLRTETVLAREDDRPVPELTRAKGVPGDGHIAIVYFTHGELETYDPIGWINQFNEFDEQNIAFVPTIARPLFIHQLRSAYLKVGSSHHRQMTIKCCRVWRKPTGKKVMRRRSST